MNHTAYLWGGVRAVTLARRRCASARHIAERSAATTIHIGASRCGRLRYNGVSAGGR